MKIITALLFLLHTSTGMAQSDAANRESFRVFLVTYNHAEFVFRGTTSYLLTDSFVQVTKKGFLDTANRTIYRRPLENKEWTAAGMHRIRLDTLQNYYCNYCIMATSGNEYFLDFSSGGQQKRIDLHHYYLQQLDEIIQIINANLPAEYQIRYLDKDTKQDCRYIYPESK